MAKGSGGGDEGGGDEWREPARLAKLTLTRTLTRVRSRGFSRRSREAAKSGLGRSGAHRTRSRAAERSSDALPCRSVALRRLGASNAGPRHWRLSSAAAEASDRSWEWRYIDR